MSETLDLKDKRIAELEAKLAEAQATINRLSAPMSDTEWEANRSEYRDGVYEEAMQREYVDAVITASLNPPVEAV